MTDRQWVMVPKEATEKMWAEYYKAVEERKLIPVIWNYGFQSAIAARPPIPPAVLEQMVERGARAILQRQGFGFYDNPMDGGQDAYDLTIDALDEARACILSALSIGDA